MPSSQALGQQQYDMIWYASPSCGICTQEALAEGKCVVIGLQSTGDARTIEAVAERAVDGELDDFVSGPKV
jgi:hypothetical protein